MAISEDAVLSVVTEVSKRMSDPDYGQIAIGSFVEEFPDVGRFVSAHAREIGGAEGVAHAVFHAQVLAECLRHEKKRGFRAIGFPELDAVASGDVEKKLAEREPALASYVASNVDDPGVRRLVSHVGLALVVAAR
jgi:hypothetical protein